MISCNTIFLTEVSIYCMMYFYEEIHDCLWGDTQHTVFKFLPLLHELECLFHVFHSLALA